MEIVNPLAEQYADEISSNNDALLNLIFEETCAKHPKAHMLSGKVQGQFLSFLSEIISPKYILEIGTFTGYSAICLAKGLQNDGELHTIELREADAITAQAYFNHSKQVKQIHLHQGDALEIIPKLPYKWDIVFIDADKTGYVDYYKMILPLLSENGIMIVDNVLFHGQVLTSPLKGKNAKAIDAFNKYVAADEQVNKVLLTCRDGLLLIKRKKE